MKNGILFCSSENGSRALQLSKIVDNPFTREILRSNVNKKQWYKSRSWADQCSWSHIWWTRATFEVTSDIMTTSLADSPAVAAILARIYKGPPQMVRVLYYIQPYSIHIILWQHLLIIQSSNDDSSYHQITILSLLIIKSWRTSH